MMNNEYARPTNQPNKPTLLEAYSELGNGECRVLKKMAEGKTNRQIAEELYISPKTVENHITKIGNTLGRKGRGKVRAWLENELSHTNKSKNNRDAH